MNLPSRDAPCSPPLYDEWAPFQHAGAWLWEPRDRPARDDAPVLNAWAADSLRRTLDALHPLVRLRSLLPNAAPGSASPPERRWDAGPNAVFEAGVIETVRRATVPITSAEGVLDVLAWYRTRPDEAPARRWLCAGATLDLQFETADPYGALRVRHTLFSRTPPDAGELAALNQPLLAAALWAISAQIGPVVHAEGLPGVTSFGFEPVPS